VDVRGRAGTTRWIRPGWTTADMTADLYAAVPQLGLRRPAIAGCSMGSTTGSGRLLKYGCDRVAPLRDQLRVRPGIPPSPSWRRRQRCAIRSIIRARLVCPDRCFVPFAVVVPALERAGRIPATYRRQLTTAHTRDSTTSTTPAASR